jgi:hypothetical protein
MKDCETELKGDKRHGTKRQEGGRKTKLSEKSEEINLSL